MQRYAIIDGINVVNVINYETPPDHPLPGLDSKYIAVESDVASPGYTYVNNIFTPPQPYPSWILENNVWIAPIPAPNNGPCIWNESLKSWVTV